MERKVVEREKDSKRKRSCKLSKVIACTAVLIVAIAIAVLSLAVAPVMAQEEEDKVTVTVKAPEYVEEKETFDVTIDADDITDFNTGLFYLSFDRSVVKVTSVEDGSIDGESIPVDMWKFTERDTIEVFLNVPGVAGVNGSGYLAKINFKVKGDEGDECLLDLFLDEGALANKDAEEIPAEGIDAEITVGAGKEEKKEEPPDITAWEPTEEEVSSIEGESMTFEIAVDQTVDISWQINGTEVQTDESETEADFTKTAEAGTWNVSVIVTSKKTGLSSMHTWIWDVTPTEAPGETPTPTPTLAPGVTPSPTPTLAPGETPTPKPTGPAVKPKPTVTPTAPPKEATPTPTPKPAVPGFEAIFAIAAMSGIAYILLKTRRRGKVG